MELKVYLQVDTHAKKNFIIVPTANDLNFSSYLNCTTLGLFDSIIESIKATQRLAYACLEICVSPVYRAFWMPFHIIERIVLTVLDIFPPGLFPTVFSHPRFFLSVFFIYIFFSPGFSSLGSFSP